MSRQTHSTQRDSSAEATASGASRRTKNEARSGTAATPLSPDAIRELHFFMRLAREWDLRFEKLFKIGKVSKWYSSVGNEGITVPTASAIEAGDALVTLHRDSGAILRYYLRSEQVLPSWLEPGFDRREPQEKAETLLYRLACQMLGKHEGFSAGHERSYHYGLIRQDVGLLHMGMISHLGAMIPVAAGMAMALKQQGTDRVAVNFIGDGGTSTGDFHETLNMASVLKLPFVLIIENNQYAFSTPTREQYLVDSLAERGAGYGIPGIQVDGNDALAVHAVLREAVARARKGDGPTLVEAMVGRLRGHSEGDDSLDQVPTAEQERFKANDTLKLIEREILDTKLNTQDELDRLEKYCADLIVEVVDRAALAPEPDVTQEPRSIYAD